MGHLTPYLWFPYLSTEVSILSFNRKPYMWKSLYQTHFIKHKNGSLGFSKKEDETQEDTKTSWLRFRELWMLEHHVGLGRPHSPRSQEVINRLQITQDDVYMHVWVCWEESWWEFGVGSQSQSPFPEALPKSGVITSWSWNWIPMIPVSCV